MTTEGPGSLRDATTHYLEEELFASIRSDDTLSRFLLNDCMDGVWYWDLERPEHEWMNPAFWTTLGQDSETMPHLASAWQDLIFADDRDAALEQVTRHLENPAIPYDQIVRYRHKHGSTVWVRCRGVAVRDENGKPVRMLGVHNDVTRMMEANERLMRANESKDSFLANISHELRTPMNGVLGLLEIVQLGALGAQQREYIAAAYQSAEMLLTLLNDILDLSKIEAGAANFVKAPYDVRFLIASVERLFRPKAEERGIALSSIVADDVPARLLGDEVRIRQVLVNLLSNALKFTKDGEVVIECVRQPRSGGDVLLFTVRDQGIGIAADQQRYLFTRFSQVDMELNRRHDGAGLGLAICRELVTGMGGAIGLESIEGEGSRFSFELPSEKAPDEAAAKARSAAPVRKSGLRILVAEDNQVNRMVIEAMCAAEGHVVVTVTDGKEALDVFDPVAFDLILMDMQMPRMDGIEATRRIRERWTGSCVPIIALTANASEAHRKMCVEAGMNAFLSKPIKIETLRAEIGDLLSDDAPALEREG